MRKLTILVLLLLITACGLRQPTETETLDVPTGDLAIITTSKGQIKIKLESDKAPRTVKNFKRLVNQGFYDDQSICRYEENDETQEPILWQTGNPDFDPRVDDNCGNGGSGQNIKLEIFPQLTNIRGAIGMARLPDNPDSANSQFYVLLTDLQNLNGRYSIFGNIVAGLDVADQLRFGDRIKSIELK